MNIKARADALFEYMRDIRHDLHMYPELGLMEFRTTKKIAEELKRFGIPYTLFEPTGLMCDIKGNKPGSGFIALRADMDALPIQEKTGLPYESKNDGVMHACAHEMHSTMLLGAAKILNELKDEFGGTIRCIFQPSEENVKGAKAIIAQGAADGPTKFMGIHTWTNFLGNGPVGGFDIIKLAGVSNFKVTIKGSGCHGQSPQLGIDSLLIAAQTVVALQSIVSRRVSPFDSVVCSIGKIDAGVAPNIVAEETTFEGTIRCHDIELTHKLKDWFCTLVEGLARSYGGYAEIDYQFNTLPLQNDAELSEIIFKSADKICAGKAPQMHMGNLMGGEDFTMFMEYGPVVFGYIGCGGDKMGHQSDFIAEDEAMPWGTAWYVQAALDMLQV